MSPKLVHLSCLALLDRPRPPPTPVYVFCLCAWLCKFLVFKHRHSQAHDGMRAEIFEDRLDACYTLVKVAEENNIEC